MRSQGASWLWGLLLLLLKRQLKSQKYHITSSEYIIIGYAVISLQPISRRIEFTRTEGSLVYGVSFRLSDQLSEFLFYVFKLSLETLN